jgi:hypothetical protein
MALHEDTVTQQETFNSFDNIYEISCIFTNSVMRIIKVTDIYSLSVIP